jgi:hypothetical protein
VEQLPYLNPKYDGRHAQGCQQDSLATAQICFYLPDTLFVSTFNKALNARDHYFRFLDTPTVLATSSCLPLWIQAGKTLRQSTTANARLSARLRAANISKKRSRLRDTQVYLHLFGRFSRLAIWNISSDKATSQMSSVGVPLRMIALVGNSNGNPELYPP